MGESLPLYNPAALWVVLSLNLVVSDNCSPGSIMKAEFA